MPADPSELPVMQLDFGHLFCEKKQVLPEMSAQARVWAHILLPRFACRLLAILRRKDRRARSGYDQGKESCVQTLYHRGGPRAPRCSCRVVENLVVEISL
jgi:hypothetical protein